METERTKEHLWLERLKGDWTYEGEATMEPGAAPMKSVGTENVRSIGGLWALCEGACEMPDGCTGTTLMTLGYDPAKGRFVGTFIASIMTHLWLYEGSLNPEGTALTLDTEGPGFGAEGSMAKYQDTIAFEEDGSRTLTSRALGEDGQWREFMTAHYRLKG